MRSDICKRLIIYLTFIGIKAGATIYSVGPGLPMKMLKDIPWETLEAGDRIFVASAPTPYREKLFVYRGGSDRLPIRITGVTGPDGSRPVISGEGAVNTYGRVAPSDGRAVLRIGSSGQPHDEAPSNVVIENFEIRGARQTQPYSGIDGSELMFEDFPSAIWIESGRGITIQNCIITDSDNGLVTSSRSAQIVVRGCHFQGSGVDGSTQYHQSYTESHGVLFEFNRFSPMNTGSLGNSLKDRSSGTVIRYNWIDGRGRLLDLVDSDHADIRNDSLYQTSLVYGNVLLKESGRSNQVCHYGGDSGMEGNYRTGTLGFYNNTIVARGGAGTVLFRMPTGRQRILAERNIFFGETAKDSLAITQGGQVTLSDNWISRGWKVSFEDPVQGRVETGRLIEGTDPGFLDAQAQNYTLRPGMLKAMEVPTVSQSFYWPKPEYLYQKHQTGVPRPPEPLRLGAEN